MKFSDIFVPRWQNSNPDVRKRAVERLKDIKLLSRLPKKIRIQASARRP